MIDTETKRKSILNFSDGDLLPVADGSFAQGDRFTLLDLYSGIAAVAQAAFLQFTAPHGFAHFTAPQRPEWSSDNQQTTFTAPSP